GKDEVLGQEPESRLGARRDRQDALVDLEPDLAHMGDVDPPRRASRVDLDAGEVDEEMLVDRVRERAVAVQVEAQLVERAREIAEADVRSDGAKLEIDRGARVRRSVGPIERTPAHGCLMDGDRKEP